jgi:hypothetical protein
VESVDRLLDEGSFVPFADALAPADPLGFPGYRDALEKAREQHAGDESVVCGAGTIAGIDVEHARFDFSFLGGSMGEVAGERIARALERAAGRQVPFVLSTATGGARMQEGILSLSLLHDAPVIGYLRGVIGAADFVMEQLALGIAHEPQELRTASEKLSRPIQLLDAGCERSQQRRQALGSLFVVHLVMLCHSHLEGRASALGRVRAKWGRER